MLPLPLKLQAIHTCSFLPSPFCTVPIRLLAQKNYANTPRLRTLALVVANISQRVQTKTLLSKDKSLCRPGGRGQSP